MNSETSGSVAADFEQLIAAAATAYQAYQLAAQQADVEGRSLAAAVFRSISEGHSARAQSLMQIRDAVAPERGSAATMTEANTHAALARTDHSDALSASVGTRIRQQLPAALADDFDAALALSATNRMRLENLLAGLAPAGANVKAG